MNRIVVDGALGAVDELREGEYLYLPDVRLYT
jgi:hypothetical protein